MMAIERNVESEGESGVRRVRAERLLPDLAEVRAALHSVAYIDNVVDQASPPSVGELVRSAARDYAYRRFVGSLEGDGTERPVFVTAMALVFASAAITQHTFDQVAQAAHLRTRVEECSVAVETVTSPKGLVSYWGFIHDVDAIVIVALDTLDPQRVSVADLRSLVTAAVRRLARARGS